MAIISRIRKRNGLVMALIALAVLGFMIMDMVSNSGRGGGAFGSTTIGKINGTKVDLAEFQNVESVLYSNMKGEPYGTRDKIWDFFVTKELLGEISQKTGLAVGKEELLELQFDPNYMSNVVKQRFTNQSNGQVDFQQLSQIKGALESDQLPANFKPFWAAQEKEVINERLQAKFGNAVAKGIYTPTWMVEQEFKDGNTKLDFLYVKVPTTAVSDSEVKVSDEDLNKYLNKYRARYVTKDELRKIAYVVFDVKPTSSDSMVVKQKLEVLLPEFKSTSKDSAFVTDNEGVYVDSYIAKKDISEEKGDEVVSVGVGNIYGPYIENNSYRAVKILGKMILPDSVKSRHILIQGKTPEELVAGRKTLDSLKNLILSGRAKFDSLAMTMSQDGGSSAKGGDLGYMAHGALVRPFNEFIFYKSKGNEMEIIETQFGVHLVQVMDKKFIKNEAGYKVAMLAFPIVPSEATQKAVKIKADDYLAANRTYENMVKTGQSNPSLAPKISGRFTNMAYDVAGFGQGNVSRDLVKRAFADDSKLDETFGEVFTYQDKDLYFDNKYVIAALKTVIPAGKPSLDALRDELEPIVKAEKKAEIFNSKISGKDIFEIATTYGITVDTATNVAYNSTFVPNLGTDGKIVSTAFATGINTVSKAVGTKDGLVVMKPYNKLAPPSNITDFSFYKGQIGVNTRRSAPNLIMNALKKGAQIVDERSKFF
jgi:peptidyl-prolyl cis-trans isomerase D